MIRVTLFDLGLTLIDAHNRPFDHVREALAAVASFKTADGKPLKCCLVSDFTMPVPPSTARKISAIFKDYLAVLEPTGLRGFFEPVQRRVTLSAHAGALKPERAVFETALRRLRLAATLDECLFITENAAHVKAAREQLQMQALQFRAAGSASFDFEDWSRAPALIAQLVAPHQVANTRAAAQAQLAGQGVEISALESAGGPDAFKASGQVWHPVSGLSGAKPVHVAVPVSGTVTRSATGALSTSVPAPSKDSLAEAEAFARSLAAHGQIAGAASPRARAATHEIVTDDKGQRKLVRKRFSAI